MESLEERALLAAITVTNAESSGDGSLAAAIAQANDQDTNPGPDTIKFARGVGGEIAVDSELVITDDLTIRGPGAAKLTISGQESTRVFTVISEDLANPISVDIHRVTIADGAASDAPGFPPEFGFAFGGGLYNLGSHVTVEKVHFVGNQAGVGALSAGGAIANEFGGSLTVRKSEFVDNSATALLVAGGGGITSDIGPSLDGDGTPGQPVITISHSSFSGNVATALVADPSIAGPFAPFAGFAFGGAFANLAGDASISHSHFVGNLVQGGEGAAGFAGGLANGGAIYTNDFSPFDEVPPLPGRDSSLDVSHSRFEDNHSIGGTGDTGARGGVAAGGAISASISFLPDSASIRHSVFQHNSATGGTGGADGGAGGGAGGPAVGGALSVLAGADVAVAHSRFHANVAQGGMGTDGGDGGDGSGGAIGLGRIVTAVPTELEALVPVITVRHTQLRGNLAAGGTGDAGGHGGNGNGGGLGVTAGATANVAKSLILRNRAVGGDGGAGGNGGNGQGGGVYNSGSSTTLARSIVFRNHAAAGDAGEGGDDGLGLGGGLFNSDDGDLLGTLSVDRLTRMLTRFNHADDAGDNVFGDLS